MTAKRVGAYIAGALFLLLGASELFGSTRMLLRAGHDAWLAGDAVGGILLGGYFLWCAMRFILWANGNWESGQARIKWGPIVLGAFILWVQVKNHFHPTPQLFTADNETQAQGMAAASVLIGILAVFLIFWGVSAPFRASHRARPGADV